MILPARFNRTQLLRQKFWASGYYDKGDPQMYKKTIPVEQAINHLHEAEVVHLTFAYY